MITARPARTPQESFPPLTSDAPPTRLFDWTEHQLGLRLGWSTTKRRSGDQQCLLPTFSSEITRGIFTVRITGPSITRHEARAQLYCPDLSLHDGYNGPVRCRSAIQPGPFQWRRRSGGNIMKRAIDTAFIVTFVLDNVSTNKPGGFSDQGSSATAHDAAAAIPLHELLIPHWWSGPSCSELPWSLLHLEEGAELSVLAQRHPVRCALHHPGHAARSCAVSGALPEAAEG